MIAQAPPEGKKHFFSDFPQNAGNKPGIAVFILCRIFALRRVRRNGASAGFRLLNLRDYGRLSLAGTSLHNRGIVVSRSSLKILP